MRACAAAVWPGLIVPCNGSALVAVGALWSKKYSRLVSKGQDNFADVLAALHAGMGGARLLKRKG
jgi:hypothetical protein